MKNLLICFGLLVAASSAVQAQDNSPQAPRPTARLFSQDRAPQTPHTSSYVRDQTRQELVHRNAALRAAQRRERMAINAYFGYSPSRPPAGTVPFMGSPIGRPPARRSYTVYPGIVFPRPYTRL